MPCCCLTWSSAPDNAANFSVTAKGHDPAEQMNSTVTYTKLAGFLCPSDGQAGRN